jgi:hypothetical protein
MTPDNFNWFLHTMLFYHTQHVIQKQAEAEEEEEEEEEDMSCITLNKTQTNHWKCAGLV